MYNIKGKKAVKNEIVTFAEIGMQESEIEEILRNSIDMLCDDEESLLVVGQQVKNTSLGRSDLTAVDNDGNIVLIEIKRDKKDIELRKEAFEFQAIRYAASYATIESADDLVKKVYAPYIEKYRKEFEFGDLNSYEIGIRKLTDFLRVNDSENSFNRKQRIMLVASEYDEQTLSAVAWLNSNNVDISCFKLTPYKIGDEIYLEPEKLLPLAEYDDYYLDLISKASPQIKHRTGITHRSLPKIDSLLEWGVVKAGDIITARGRENEATLLKNGNVSADGKETSMQAWLKEIYGWSSVHTFYYAILKENGKSLLEIRDDYMNTKAEETEREM